MKLIDKFFRQESDSREKAITTASGLCIVVNLLIAVVKMVVGLSVASMAIVSEGVNNATDAATSVLTIVGTRLSKKHSDKKHPFGYGRIEYLTSLVISMIILFSGAELLISTIKLIFEPAALSISVVSLVVVAVSALAKFFLGIYTIRTGKRVHSGALVGVGTENRNDSFASIITILSAVVFLVFHLNIDAYAGLVTALIILKAGLELLRDTVSELLGRPGEAELAATLYREIRAVPEIVSAADMMLHNYGPNAYSGSVNIEIDHQKTVGEVYETLHDLQLRIMHEQKVTMVFGIYAVDNDSAELKALRKQIAAFTTGEPQIQSFHALYIAPESGTIYCDFIVSYALKDWQTLRERFEEYMERLYPGRKIELTIETEFV